MFVGVTGAVAGVEDELAGVAEEFDVTESLRLAKSLYVMPSDFKSYAMSTLLKDTEESA